MKESAYNLCAQDRDGTYYLFNTRRGAAHVLSADAYRTYSAAAAGRSAFEGAEDVLRELVNKGFLVENDADELAEIMAAHDGARQSRARLEVLIAPTMACNLDCFYCFEANRYRGHMSLDVQANTVRLVRSYFESGTRQLDVTWYGGEPLLALPAIEHLSREFVALCDRFGSEYSASIVTNGTLMTAAKARQLASWKVKRAQITLDGVPEQHDVRRVPKNGGPTFFRILDGIEAAAAHMHVCVRINACRQVVARLDELLQILAARGLNRVITVYVAPLQKAQHHKLATQEAGQACRSPATRLGCDDLDTLDGRSAADLALTFNDLLRRYEFAVADRLPHPRCTTCMADREHSWLIEANGDIQKCYWTAGLRAEAVGRLTEEGIVLQTPYGKWRDWTESRNSECLTCVMLPVCLGRCPLNHLRHDSNYCPPFRYNWMGALARATGAADAQLAPARLPLAPEKVKELKFTIQ